jgi:hypothetical protein
MTGASEHLNVSDLIIALLNNTSMEGIVNRSVLTRPGRPGHPAGETAPSAVLKDSEEAQQGDNHHDSYQSKDNAATN